MVKKMSSDNSDYGFFCDIETAIINDYEEVEYYVATTSTRYEVRRKWIRRKAETIKVEKAEEKEDSSDEVCFPVQQQQLHDNPGCFSAVFRRLARVPKDIYYSFLVCSITASCVVFVMTYEHNEMT
jgi:hypothetical protein